MKNLFSNKKELEIKFKSFDEKFKYFFKVFLSFITIMILILFYIDSLVEKGLSKSVIYGFYFVLPLYYIFFLNSKIVFLEKGIKHLYSFNRQFLGSGFGLNYFLIFRSYVPYEVIENVECNENKLYFKLFEYPDFETDELTNLEIQKIKKILNKKVKYLDL